MALTLLLVDDDALDREAVRRALRQVRSDVQVIDAPTADDALRLAQSAVDCILLDYQLPGTDGLSVLRRLRDSGVDAPVIALTGHGDEHTAVELMKAGAADYLSKQTLTPDRLERSLRHALAMADAERQRRELLAREQAARQEAQRANRLKDEFLATLSHELRTPLNAILGWTRLLAGNAVDADTFRRGFEIIERNVRVQVRLIDDLLDVSRIVTGKLAIEKQPVLLSGIVGSAVESQRPAAENAGLSLLHALAGDERPVLGDAARLQQVITNLLSNSIKFTPRGGRIDLSLVFSPHDAVLTIRDTGIGIDAAFLPHVFERFRQGDASTTRQRTGLGLGLAIVKHLVEAHGGQIAVESAGPGHGATFRVALPTIGVRSDQPSPDAHDAPALDRISVLLVDDDRDSREMMTEVLRRSGARVIDVGNAREALAAARAQTFDVLLTDIAMPDADGYALLAELRTLRPHRVLAAAAITACALPEDRARALAAGFTAHLAKPCEPARLIEVVATLASVGGEESIVRPVF